jgi:hypothetical protein
VLLLFWLSKDPASPIGKSPQEALSNAPNVRAAFEAELEDRSPSGGIPRAILGRYLCWLSYFGEQWVRDHLEDLFPPDNKALRDAAWFAHVQSDQGPVASLVEALRRCYSDHISVLGSDASSRPEAADNRLAQYLMVLYLWDKLPEDLLEQFWQAAPQELLRQAMWFVGRHLSPDSGLQARAITYWDRRLRLAMQASDPTRYQKELGIIGQWFLWKVDDTWLMDQLLIMLNAGFAPNDAIGVIDNLAKHIPDQIDKVVEITKALVKQPKVESWVLASQGQALREVLIQAKASDSPITVAAVQEIVSHLSARGNTDYLDLAD